MHREVIGELEHPGITNVLAGQLNERVWPVHRLDTPTSGLLIVARSAAAAATFGQLFESHQVQKYYLAVAGNKPRKKQGAVVGDMEKARRGNWRLATTRTNPAITQFFSTALQNPDWPHQRLYLLKPLTGRTHQLRVALKSLGAPILGDKRYGGAPATNLHLHAFGLCFRYAETAYECYNLPVESEAFSGLAAILDGAGYTLPEQCPWPTIAQSNGH